MRLIAWEAVRPSLCRICPPRRFLPGAMRPVTIASPIAASFYQRHVRRCRRAMCECVVLSIVQLFTYNVKDAKQCFWVRFTSSSPFSPGEMDAAAHRLHRVISWLRITRVMPKLLRLLCYTGIPIGFYCNMLFTKMPPGFDTMVGRKSARGPRAPGCAVTNTEGGRECPV